MKFLSRLDVHPSGTVHSFLAPEKSSKSKQSDKIFSENVSESALDWSQTFFFETYAFNESDSHYVKTRGRNSTFKEEEIMRAAADAVCAVHDWCTAFFLSLHNLDNVLWKYRISEWFLFRCTFGKFESPSSFETFFLLFLLILFITFRQGVIHDSAHKWPFLIRVLETKKSPVFWHGQKKEWD